MRPLSGAVAVVSIAVALSACAQPVVASDQVEAGVARAQFDLPKGVPLAGYSKRKGSPSRGLHDPVGVRALVLQDGPVTAVLVSCDLLIVDEHLFEAVRRRLRAGGFPEDFVLILAGTHTHSGPGAYGMRFLEKISMGHFDPAVFEVLVRAISETVRRARAERAPIRLAAATVMTEGLVKNRTDPSGAVDPELVAVAFYRQAEASPFAVLVNFTAHPTALGSWNRYLSADYPGALAAALERRWPGATCLFIAGSVGDQAPAKAGIGFERAAWIGETLAQQVASALEAAHPTPPSMLRAAQERLVLPPARIRLGRRLTLPRWMGQRLVDDDATLSALIVGEAAFLGVPCDLAAALGQGLKAAARSRGLTPVIVGFASDYIGYCVSERTYQTGRYEALMAFNGPTAGPLVVNRLIEMLTRLDSSQQSPPQDMAGPPRHVAEAVSK